jgi:carbamoylphosphate synthase large subunit
VKRRLLLTGAGTTAASNLIRSLRADPRPPTIIGCHDDRFVLKKSEADRNYLTPALGHPAFLRALARVIKKERIDLLIPTSDAEVRVVAHRRARIPCRLFLPRTSVIELCQDKYRLNTFLRARGVPAPLTYPVTSVRAIAKTFARLRANSLVWCRARAGSGALAALPVRSPAQARSWIAYWRDMRKIPATAFTLSEYLPGRDFSCLSLWDRGTLIVLKTCQRLSYFTGGGSPSGISSVSHLAKTVTEPAVARVCVDAVRALDRRASGTFNLDLRENGEGVPCVTEINAGRFPSGNLIHALTGRRNISTAFMRVALGERVGFCDEYDADEGWYTVRDLDTPMGIFHVDDLFDKIVDARE